MLRQAHARDIPGMHRVRLAVKENRLISSVISEADYLPAIKDTGRGWVVEVDGQVIGFAVGTRTTGNIWALFVDPAYERNGYGRQLHDVMIEWLRDQGLAMLWLTTASGTRAERFYEKAGWKRAGVSATGEVRFERTEPTRNARQ